MGGGRGLLTPSDIGSRERENVDVDAFGVGENGERVGGGRKSWSCNWPSNTDCFRAWGWLSGREAERAKGEDILGDVGAKQYQRMWPITIRETHRRKPTLGFVKSSLGSSPSHPP